MNKLVIFTLAGLLSAGAVASDQNPILPPPQQKEIYLRNDNNSTTIVFKGGREAQIYHSIGKITPVQIAMKQVENTCNFGQKLSTCNMNLDVASYNTALVWTKHPEASKIGKVVKVRYKSSAPQNNAPFEEIKSDNDLLGWYPQRKEQYFSKVFRPDNITCNSLEWAQDFIDSKNILTVESWGAEFMTPTPETGVNENQTLATTFDIKFAVQGNQLTFAEIGRTYARFILNTVGPYVTGQVANLNMISQKDPNQSCQVSFEMSLGTVLSEIRSPEFMKPDPSTVRPVGKFYRSTSPNVGFKISNLLKGPSYWEAE